MSPYRENAKMPDEKVKPGDVVVLKSGGGPKMTIASIEANGIAKCIFFNSKDELTGHSMNAIALKVAE